MSLFKLRKKGRDEGRREKKHLQEEEDGNRKIEILKEQNTTKEKRKSHTHRNAQKYTAKASSDRIIKAQIHNAHSNVPL